MGAASICRRWTVMGWNQLAASRCSVSSGYCRLRFCKFTAFRMTPSSWRSTQMAPLVSANAGAIGIDLGGTNLKLALLDGENRITARLTVPTGGAEGHGAVIERMIDGARVASGGEPGCPRHGDRYRRTWRCRHGNRSHW